MAEMSPAERAKVLAQAMREIGWPGLTKPDLLAAVNAVDTWVESNTASYNSALPLPFRTVASTDLKALLLTFVVMRRVGRLHVEGE